MPPICPLCKSKTGFLLDTKDLNRKISEKKFDYWKCSACDLVFLSKVPEDLKEYYQDYHSNIPTIKKLSQIARKNKYQIDMIQKFVNQGSLLEIGSGFGVFAYLAKESGFKVDAIEMDKRCCEFMSREIGINVTQSDKPHEALKKMSRHDVVTLWHNIEHLLNPWACLDAIAENLDPGGILVIATPNPASLGLRILGPFWPHIDAPRHINLIPARLLTKYLEPLGLNPILITANDKGAKSWNRFSWQRYFMNHFSSRTAQSIGFLVGGLVSLLMAIFESQKMNGSAYTTIYQKKP